jgi:hypothetical protein
MTLQDFKNTLQHSSPPIEISLPLKALWFDAHGNWDKAHELAQEEDTQAGSWIHAYLHRKEGDRSNAQYWYNQANRKMPSYSLEHEWEEIVIALLTSLHQ